MYQRKDDIFSKDVHFSFHDSGIGARVRLSTILGHMSDIAGDDFRDLGYSHEWLEEHNMVFLVSRLSVHLNRYIMKNEDVTLSTYERGIKGPMCFRNYEFIGKDGLVAIGGKAAWVLCDPKTHRIMKPAHLGYAIHDSKDRLTECPEPVKLHTPKDADFIHERLIGYSDIDSNGHLFNAYYADIALNTLTNDLLSSELTDFMINYQNEAKLGETLALYLKAEGNKASVYGIIKETNLACFTCEFTFKA